MKLTILSSIALQFLAITPALSCLRTYGVITNSGGSDAFVFALAIDNGAVVCSSSWGNVNIDQDGHFSLPCWSGYVYAMTFDGYTAWYSNGVQSWQLAQGIIPDINPGVWEWWEDNWFGC
jgi:hypothetical protein